MTCQRGQFHEHRSSGSILVSITGSELVSVKASGTVVIASRYGSEYGTGNVMCVAGGNTTGCAKSDGRYRICPVGRGATCAKRFGCVGTIGADGETPCNAWARAARHYVLRIVAGGRGESPLR